MRKLVMLCLGLAVLCCAAWAQEITGNIRGTVSDPSGAVIPNATVTVTNTDRNQVLRTITTNNSGEYVAPLLPVGHYTVAVDAPGFKKFTQTAIELNVNDRLTINAPLQTGNATETVNVEADPLQVNLQSAAQEGLISGTQVRQLPLNNRNYEQLVTLQPGVTSNAADSLYVGTTSPQGSVNIVSFSINGNRQSQNNWTIDGADNVDHGSNITLLVYPSVDGIGEFKVLRSNYNPEFGRSASGQVNVVTRGGASKFHGSLYEFFRNDALNAQNAFLKHTGQPQEILRYNDFGGTIGGPIYIPGVYNTNKDKTFFFFSEEARRVHTNVTETADTPTPAELGGTFPVPVCVAIDATGACTATRSRQLISRTFSANCL
jgi:Carboxypeptidase regulatory-like domain